MTIDTRGATEVEGVIAIVTEHAMLDRLSRDELIEVRAAFNKKMDHMIWTRGKQGHGK